jgi:hypothetical protein
MDLTFNTLITLAYCKVPMVSFKGAEDKAEVNNLLANARLIHNLSQKYIPLCIHHIYMYRSCILFCCVGFVVVYFHISLVSCIRNVSFMYPSCILHISLLSSRPSYCWSLPSCQPLHHQLPLVPHGLV